MKLNNHYAIGTHVMFYEVEVFPEFVESLLQAISTVENPQNITIDFTFNYLEHFEKIDWDSVPGSDRNYFRDKFNSECEKLKSAGVNVVKTILAGESYKYPYTIANYRRDFNYRYAQLVDLLIWGETDCLLPKETFDSLETVSNFAKQNNIWRYTATFATRKMWDNSWTVLEHPDFTDKEYYETDNPKAFTEKHSIRYTMNIDEMNEVNSKQDEFQLTFIRHPKFDGSGLVIASDLIKAGVNIPLGIIGFSGEDTSFQVSCLQIMNQNYFQFVIKNILKVHNRDHQRKRLYAVAIDGEQTTQKEKGKYYNVVRDLSKKNLPLLDNSQNRFFTWNDLLEKK